MLLIGSASITLKVMGKGDHRPRTTRQLNAVQLAALTKESAKETPTTAPAATATTPSVAAPAATATPSTTQTPTSHDEPLVARGRTATIDDPMTTGLLAEVARQQQTQEFDDDILELVKTSVDKVVKPGETRQHPHVRKRSS